MTNILIYGGSFNPLHNGHDAIIKHCTAMQEYDGLWVMPSARRRDKPDLISDDERLKMLRHYWALLPSAIAARVFISDFEVLLGQPSETLRTDDALKQEFPDIEFSYIFGVDAVNDMSEWNGGDRLRNELDILMVGRAGHRIPKILKNKYIELPDSWTVSSTLVRQRVRTKQAIDHLVPPAILEIIESNVLYK